MITLLPQCGYFCESLLEVSGEPLVLVVQAFKEFVEQPTWRILGTIVCHNWRTPERWQRSWLRCTRNRFR
jgi:hypothetical protein